ncbi:uracil-DNA glycosylase [Chloroflexota bacterium]
MEIEIIKCQNCPRLVEWREEIAKVKRKAYLDWTYWGKPVPGFGDPKARVLSVGLAPGAHGSNRTGRIFTGDGSGDFLFPILHQLGFASQKHAVDLNDGMILTDLYITAICRCVPPANKPTQAEISACIPYLKKEIEIINPGVFVALGKIAYDGIRVIFPGSFTRKPFTHGAIYSINKNQTVICSYHPSRQNTQTGRLTNAMFRAIWKKASELVSD